MKLHNSMFVASLDDENVSNGITSSNDIEIEECYSPDTVGKIFGNSILSESAESLPYKERLAIFYRFIKQFEPEEIKLLLGYRGEKSTPRLFGRSFKKLRNDYFKNGGKKNDWI